MLNIAIIGAGELGSRHLQGLLKISLPQNIYVLDKSDISLTRAMERANEIKHNHKIHYINQFHLLPNKLTLAIIATNANVRAKVLIEILSYCDINYLILEKVLFQSVDDFDRIDNLIYQKRITGVWVNHPRRLYPGYRELKKVLDQRGIRSSISIVSASNWGLGCNALHFIDLFSYLWNSPLRSLSFSLIHDKLIESKRPGFVEFTGQIIGSLENDVQFLLNSFTGEKSPFNITFIGSNFRMLFTENGRDEDQLSLMPDIGPLESWIGHVKSLPQSDLTGQVLEDLIFKGTCQLTDYHISSKMHRSFVEGLLEKYNSITGSNAIQCPIT